MIERLREEGKDGARSRLRASRLYLLATTALCRRPLLETVRLALRGGVDAVQLREKGIGDREFRRLALEVGEVVREAGALFLLNDRVAVAGVVPCDGVHVGQEDLAVPDVRRILGPGPIVGVSTHSLEQARRAEEETADYVGVGPVFETATKETGYGPRGADLAAEVTRALRIPAFAIGGVTPETLRLLAGSGTLRVAVSAAICAAEDPLETARRMREALGPLSPGAPRGSRSRRR